MFTGIGTPQSIAAAVDSTNSWMGVRQADEGSMHYSWSYHPDNGLNMVITEKSGN